MTTTIQSPPSDAATERVRRRERVWAAVNQMLLWKGEPCERYTAAVLTTIILLHNQGVSQIGADDVDDSFLGSDDRNIIGGVWFRLNKAGLIKPVLELIPGTCLPFTNSKGKTIQVTRESDEKKAHANSISVWTGEIGMCRAWLRDHGYQVPQDEKQLVLC